MIVNIRFYQILPMDWLSKHPSFDLTVNLAGWSNVLPKHSQTIVTGHGGIESVFPIPGIARSMSGFPVVLDDQFNASNEERGELCGMEIAFIHVTWKSFFPRIPLAGSCRSPFAEFAGCTIIAASMSLKAPRSMRTCFPAPLSSAGVPITII